MAQARNVAIVLGLAAVIAFVPGGGLSGQFVVTLLSVLFLASLAWFAAIFYREHRVTILSLGDRMRAVLYGSLVAAVLAVVGTSRLWHSGPAGVLVWSALIGGASFGMFTVYRSYRTY